ncbi:polysaccharide deacetylase family protein [Paenibacillus sp. UNC499MF]|uniref:polysaccharide deacetylase family protein n=1 Tax=Paenibacillus sp. UNC499MF TaxID=1502751 RepID=UPI0008A09612|nr:polysaccharide deacetylase family protein [Paenibacillus sp. UNC499MF]SEG74600.1 Peptidoglycan/xylan/chitin deacetylase, PgdA/CDA1 family [Paenibacillus sp. UNC499MF]
MKRAALAASAAILLAFVSACSPEKVPSEGSASSRLDENRFIPHSLSEEPAASSIPRSAKIPSVKAPAIKGKSAATPSALPAVPPPLPSLPAKKAKKTAAPKPEPKKKDVPVQKHHQANALQKSEQRKLSLADIHHKYPAVFRMRGTSKGKKIALTFDDGPDLKYTPQVLDILKKHQVKATFFVIGSRARAHPEMIGRMVREGHVVGNHSYSHPFMPKLSASEFSSQIMRTQDIIKQLAGYTPRLVRPPYGAINEEQVRWMSDHRLLVINWDVDSLDWKGLSGKQVYHNIIDNARAGSIILQHSAGGNDKHDLSGTVSALPDLIRSLKSSGYKLVTVPELMGISKGL